ncbi:hypothetical protein VTJ83DRAFT_64 [Remersonia thermophila]|uniref:Cytochrome P450 n=1 Tax=Remersonia thermophila TaxID=72144 RepID=A0ABR4DK20_9PEZI
MPILCCQQTFTFFSSTRHKLQGRFPAPHLFPIIDSIHDVPRFSLWLKYKEWAYNYGPIYYTRALSQPLIIVSDQKSAEKLLVKRGHIYSGRPLLRCILDHKEGPAPYRHYFYGHIDMEMKRHLGLFLLDPAPFLGYTRELCGRVMSCLAWDDATQSRANADTWVYRYFEQLRREGGNETLEQPEDQQVFASCMIRLLTLVGVVSGSGLLKLFLMAIALHPE